MSISVPVSIGELWDKYTILLVKNEKVKDKSKQHFIHLEIENLDLVMNNYLYQENELFLNLKKVNEALWDIEDKLRIKESLKMFDNEFIELARAVYYTNDKRAEIKRQINTEFNSMLHEVKEYVQY
jgi:hypothetical protein